MHVDHLFELMELTGKPVKEVEEYLAKEGKFLSTGSIQTLACNPDKVIATVENGIVIKIWPFR